MADADTDASLQSDGARLEARLEAAVSLRLRNCNSKNKGDARETVSVKLSDPQSLLPRKKRHFMCVSILILVFLSCCSCSVMAQ